MLVSWSIVLTSRLKVNIHWTNFPASLMSDRIWRAVKRGSSSRKEEQQLKLWWKNPETSLIRQTKNFFKITEHKSANPICTTATPLINKHFFHYQPLAPGSLSLLDQIIKRLVAKFYGNFLIAKTFWNNHEGWNVELTSHLC